MAAGLSRRVVRVLIVEGSEPEPDSGRRRAGGGVIGLAQRPRDGDKGMSDLSEKLPYVDQHTVAVAAPREVVWRALEQQGCREPGR